MTEPTLREEDTGIICTCGSDTFFMDTILKAGGRENPQKQIGVELKSVTIGTCMPCGIRWLFEHKKAHVLRWRYASPEAKAAIERAYAAEWTSQFQSVLVTPVVEAAPEAAK